MVKEMLKEIVSLTIKEITVKEKTFKEIVPFYNIILGTMGLQRVRHDLETEQRILGCQYSTSYHPPAPKIIFTKE